MTWVRLVPLLLALPVLLASSCPLEPLEDDGGTADGGDGGQPRAPLRHVLFDGLEPGELSQTTIDGVTLTVAPFQGHQVVTVQDQFGEGQDVAMQCGTVTITAPELHYSFQLVFNDDGGPLLVSAFDQRGQLLTAQPIDTQADAQAVGIQPVDQIYKRLLAEVPPGAERLIGSLAVASCAGFLHEIILE